MKYQYQSPTISRYRENSCAGLHGSRLKLDFRYNVGIVYFSCWDSGTNVTISMSIIKTRIISTPKSSTYGKFFDTNQKND